MDYGPELLLLAWYTIGFSYSIFAGLLIWNTHQGLYSKFHDDKLTGWRSRITGLVERGLYTGAMLAGHLEFVGVWLVLKSVSHWDRFKSDQQDKGNVEAISKFNGYFIDTGLSIAYGITGAFVTKFLIDSHYFTAIVVMVVLSVGHLLLNRYIKCMANKEKRLNEQNIIAENMPKK